MSAELEVEDWCTITGRGDVAVVDTRKFPDGLVVKVGDMVRFAGRDGEYKVHGVEVSTYMVHPPRQAPTVGLAVRRFHGVTDTTEDE